MRYAAAVAFVALLAHNDISACGICVDDKVAATYDYAVIQRAQANGDSVVFCEIHGPVDARRLEAGARRIRGLDARSVRVSEQPAGISFAIDRKRQTPAEVAAAIERRVPGGHLTVLRVIEATPAS